MSAVIDYYYSRFGVRGVLTAARAKLMRTQSLIKVKRPGIRHPFYLRCHTSDLPTFDQIFVAEEYAFSVSTEPKVIVDAGANIGLTAIYFANQYPAATIIAIEPEASNFAILQKNTAPYERVIPVQAALWNENKPIDLLDPGLGEWGYMTGDSSTAGMPNSTYRHTVPGLTVDKLMNDHGLTHIDILKIDIEGAEREVFMHASAWIGNVDALIVELHDRMKPGCSASFYDAVKGFDAPWQQGENVFVTKHGCLQRRTH